MTIQRCATNATAAACITTALAAAGIDTHIDEHLDDTATTLLTVEIDGIEHQLILAPKTGDVHTNTTYALWRRPVSDPRQGQTFPPLLLTHPAYHEPCTVCGKPLGDGKSVQLLVLGPVTDEDKLAHYVGAEYPALHGYCHEECIQGVAASPTE